MGPNSLANTKKSGESGASLVEYALLVALIAIVAMAGIRSVGSEVVQTYAESGQSFGQAGFSGGN